MADPRDDTGYTDGREDSAFQERQRHRPLAARDDEDDIGRRIIRRTTFPSLMLATGILWILAGAAYVALFGGLLLLGAPFETGNIWLLVVAALFLMDGIQVVRGRFRDPLLDGFFTVGIGLYFFAQAYFIFDMSGPSIASIVHCFFGCVFLIPGILALLARKDYLAWKAEQSA